MPRKRCANLLTTTNTMMIQESEIGVIIPAYNEGPMIGEVVAHVRSCGYPHVVVIDDGSKDDTRQRALEAGAEVVSHLINRGAGAASQTGIHYARQRGFSYIIQLDADGQHHPEDMKALIEKMAEGKYEIVIGSRFIQMSEGIPAMRVAYNRISNLLTNWFCRGSYSDSQSGFRMLNRKAIETLNLGLDGFGYCSEMIVVAERNGLSIGEVPISVSYTEYSMSKGQDIHMGVTTAINLLWKLIFHQTH